VAKLARLLFKDEDIAFNSDGLILEELPKLKLQKLYQDDLKEKIDIRQIDLEYERKLEKQYLRLQRAKRKVEQAQAASKNDPTGEKQQKAWCELAELEDPNPYRKKAEKACTRATRYVEQRRRLVAAMNRDWKKVYGFMKLRHRSIQDKKKVMAAFIRVYGMLSEQRPVKKAQEIYRALKKGILPYGEEGRVEWSFKTGLGVSSSPAIGSDGTIYVGSDDNKLYAINPDGSLKWSFKTGLGVSSSPAIGSDGTIYIGSDDNKLYAINPDGSLKWSFKTGGDVWSSPAIGLDGTIYVGSLDDKLYAINPDGSLKWSFKTGWAVDSSPAIGSDGTIYVGSRDSKLYAIYGSGDLADTPWPMFGHDLRHTSRVGSP
jgi:hypothetical protein